MSAPSSGLLVWSGLGSSLLLVTPVALTEENGIQASCFEQPRAAWGCNLDTNVIQGARAVLMALCVTSTIGGLLGIWAASTRNKRVGHVIWLTLTGISAAVALWNLQGFIFDSDLRRSDIGLVSIFWVWAYGAAYLRWSRDAA
jgi:hypothetical protein